MLINYISIKVTIGRFLKELGLDDTSYVEDIPQWVEDAIQTIGVSNYYVNRPKLVKVMEYKAGLPCDIQNLYGIWTSPTYTQEANPKNLRRLFIRNSPLLGAGLESGTGETGYGNINAGMIHTSFREGWLYVSYSGIPLDCDGYPLIPKDAQLNEALQYYFIYKMSLSGFVHPVVSRQEAYQMWLKLYPAAGNSVNWMDLQEYQEFTEMWTNVLLGDLNANNYIN